MSVDIFTKAQFEAALPQHKENSEPLWEEKGLIQGEWTYLINFDHPLGHQIEVRSSVRSDGQSAGTGQDSSRLWLVDKEGNLLGSKLSKYVTRVPGWGERLMEQLRTLAKLGKKLETCSCGKNQVAFKVKKPGPNKGRFFKTCSERECKRTEFEWLDETKSNQTPQPAPQPQRLTDEDWKRLKNLHEAYGKQSLLAAVQKLPEDAPRA